MFRLFRWGSRISYLGSRLNATTQATQPGPGVVRIQRVKFRRRRFKFSNVLMAGSVYILCYELYTRVVMDRLADWLDDMEAELTEEEIKEIEEQSIEPIFIRFPGFTKEVTRMYRTTDPEWQRYRDFVSNTELQQSLKSGLANLACQSLSNHPHIKEQYGGQGRVRRYTLEFHIPLKPPPTYRRQGIALGGPGGIEWTEQNIGSDAVIRTRRALWPDALALSLWTFTSSLVTQNAMTIAKMLGYETSTETAGPMQKWIKKAEQIKKQQQARSGSDPSTLPVRGRADGTPASTNPLSPIGKGAATSPVSPGPISQGVAGIQNYSPGTEDVDLLDAMRVHTSGPWDLFKRKLASKWRNQTELPPAGSVLVTGLVFLEMPGAFLTVDCQVWWDTKAKEFHSGSSSMRLRTVTPRRWKKDY
ncbi:hypothetical protein GGS20DRAFT_535951 [Poronia punctata]|nr:hypothetical protein GGS20DRAFT_535951 [Poronia punctata]